jgi:UDP-GlcNAc3NAcA epimerase
MRIATVVGNRPQFVKAAAVSRLLRAHHDEVLIHTGQHYDEDLSAIFFRELELPTPDYQLDVAAGAAPDRGVRGSRGVGQDRARTANAAQTARMQTLLTPLLNELAPDAVLVYGDTNTTLAGGLTGAQLGLAVVHVEAGMRSFDRRMPEELNRVLVDHLSTLLLCPSPAAVDQLRREHVGAEIEMVGDVMVDVALTVAPEARRRTDIPAGLGLEPGGYLLATAHRAGNVDDPERLRRLVELLMALPAPVVLPLHPRTRARLTSAGLLDRLASRVLVVEPLGYVEFTALLHQARGVLTDSGGVQKEAYLAAVPCVTLRDRTEWTETVDSGWNALVDLDATAALSALRRRPPSEHPPLYGDGRAGERVVRALARLQQAA